MARSRVTFENRIDIARQRITERPQAALKEIGKLMVKEIKPKVPKKSGRLMKSIAYWYRPRQKDLQIGSKSSFAHLIEFGNINFPGVSFLKSTIMSRLGEIQSLIQDALRGLGR
jgi:hypothetical protein